MISEIEFLRNQNQKARNKAIIHFKLIVFCIVFLTFVILNQGKYLGANSTSNDRILLGLWLLYPVYLFIFKKITLKKYQLFCESCKSNIEFKSTYRKSEDLSQLERETCSSCQAGLNLDKMDFQKK